MRPTHQAATFPRAAVVTLAVVVAAASAVAGCGADERADGWTVTVDTTASGATRVVNQPPPEGIEPAWVVEEELRLGSLDEAGPASFGQIHGLAVADDGRIAVLDAQAQELRIFDPAGRHLRTFGGKGEGPGELMSANGLMLGPEGMLWVPDPRLGRMSIFDWDEGFRESHQWQVRSYGYVWTGAIDSAGRVLEPSYSPRETERWQVLRVYDRTMQPLDSLAMERLPDTPDRDPPGAFYWEGGSVRGYISVPFYAGARSALDRQGRFWSTGDGDPAYRIARWNPGARDTTLVVESARAPVPVSAAERDSVIDEITTYLRDRGADARQDWSKVPSVKPAVQGLFIAEDGRLWVRVTTGESGVTTYDVFDPDGRYDGTAVVPADVYQWVTPVVRDGRFHAVVTDELDVQYVLAGPLREREGRAD